MDHPGKEIFEKASQQIMSDISGKNLEILSRYAKEKGAELSVDRSFEHLLFKVLGPSLMHGYESIPKVKPLPKVIFEVIEKNELNAHAIKTDVDDTYIIFVCKRLITDIELILEELINFEGNPEKERHKSDKTWMRGLFHQLIFEHELSHIFNGHLDYLANEFGLNNIEEKQNEEDAEKLNFVKQTLEMDADCCALSRLYGWLNNMSKANLPEEMNEHCSEESRNIVTSYSDIMMCFYILNKFYFNLNELTEKEGERARATPRERIMASFGNLILYIKTYNIPLNLKSLMSEINRKLILVEDLLYEVYGTPKNSEMWQDKEYLNHTEITRKILMNWEKIQPKLMKYNYIPIVEQSRELTVGDWYRKELEKCEEE